MYEELNVDFNNLSPSDKELVLEAVIEEYFGGIALEDIVELLEEHYPDNF